MGKIYHYTTIETLALILKNKTIRFNRLDKVDDMEEAMYGSGGLNIFLGQYCFVSCWTKDDKENLSLWKMYTNYKGVRIGLDEDIFVKYRVNDTFYSYFKEWSHIEGDCVFMLPNNEAKLQEIHYVPDNKSLINNLIKKEGDGISINTKDMGCIKRDSWAFQNEYRFRLIAQPLNPKLMDINEMSNLCNSLMHLMDVITKSLAQNYKVHTEYVDLPMKLEALNNIEIMLGPTTSLADKIIIDALLRDFSNTKIIDSYFKGKIRDKC